MRKSFILYTDSCIDAFEKLEPTNQAALIMAILNYVKTGEVPSLQNDAADMAFTIIRGQLDRDNEKYMETVEKRKEAGALGGKKKAENMRLANASKSSKSKQELANLANLANLAVNVTDTVNDTDTDTGSSSNAATRPPPTEPTLEEIEAYCKENNLETDTKRFYRYNQDKGWKYKNGEPADWKHLLQLWIDRDKDYEKKEQQQDKICGLSIDEIESCLVNK